MTDETVSYPEKVDAWRCSDRRVFTDEVGAQQWQSSLDAAELANQALEAGQNVGECLVISGRDRKYVPEVLFKITKNTPLIISHWQCRDESGYKVCEFKADGDIYVFGYAGSWSGSYGSDVSMRDLARYAEDTLKVVA